MATVEPTSFSDIYEAFFEKVTDDMYMELTEDETNALLQELLVAAIPHFEFPRTDLTDYDLDMEAFNNALTKEEINILADYMVVE